MKMWTIHSFRVEVDKEGKVEHQGTGPDLCAVKGKHPVSECGLMGFVADTSPIIAGVLEDTGKNAK